MGLSSSENANWQPWRSLRLAFRKVSSIMPQSSLAAALLAALALGAYALLPVRSAAQNNFVYLYYAQEHGTGYELIEKVDSIRQGENNVVALVDTKGLKIARTNEEWKECKKDIYNQQNNPEFHYEQDLKALDSLFVDILKESVSREGKLAGAADHEWKLTFIVPEAMCTHNSEVTKMLALLEFANRFQDRKVKVEYLCYNSRDKFLKAWQPNYKHKITTR